ncbi:MAG: sodium-dependent transporter [Clostridia bacterium]|nr:sodium-dependent transporter [Clostridia bacterium]
MEQKKSSFTGSIGFVLAAAGSAVGLGNIWRFPNLAAKHGGGLFILVYIALVLLFGFALLMTDIAIGRKTGMNAGNAYGAISKKWKWVGHLTFVVPAIIMMYYTVIGGWILRYFTEYVTFNGATVAQDGYFGSFISSPVSPIVFMLIYLLITAVIVYAGVEKGIEKFSKIVMPALLLLIAGIAIYSLTLSYTDASGVTRTGLEGAAIYFVPNFEGMTFGKFINVVLDAMNQMFYSLSVAMGIMITYGSYVKKDVNINKSVTQIQLFDTMVAILSGMMIVPAVCVFFGPERMTEEAGAGLMFVTLPKVFENMGFAGHIVAILFFVMVAFAALTSSVSIMETVVASCMEYFKKSRKQMSLLVAACAAIGALVVCLGYNVFYFELALPNGTVGQILDVADYVSNSVIMPFITIMTCVLIGWIVKPKWVIDEVQLNGEKFGRRGLYIVIIKFVAPVVMTILLLKALGIF